MAVPAANFSGDPPSELAAVLAKKARRAEKAGDTSQAYIYYSQASAIQPRNRGYRARMMALQARGAVQPASGLSSLAATSPASVPDADAPHAILSPADMFDSLAAREYAGERQLEAPPKLSAAAGRYDFDLNDTPRGLFDKVAARYNLQVVFDGEYPQGGSPVRLRLTQLDYREALDALQAATGSFVVPVSPHVIMVARDTPAKRNDLEQYVALTIPVPQAITPQELTEIVQLVRQSFNVEKIGWDTANDQIVIRDRISRAAPAQALLAQLVSWQPQVMIDMELLQVSDSDVLNYGFTLTSSFPLVYLGGIMQNAATVPQGVTNLLTFGAGRTLIGIGVAQVQAMFNETSSNGKAIFSARMRSASGQAATFHVGEKYPIITSGFVGASSLSSSGSSLTFAAPPAVTFENLGIQIKATPRVHGSDAVSMAIDASYEVLSGQSANGIPVIETNKITADIRLRNDEWAVVAGLIGKSDSKTSSGVAGLSRIPRLGNLFRQTSVDHESSSLLIGIRPHILSLPPGADLSLPLRVGTDARPYTPL